VVDEDVPPAPPLDVPFDVVLTELVPPLPPVLLVEVPVMVPSLLVLPLPPLPVVDVPVVCAPTAVLSLVEPSAVVLAMAPVVTGVAPAGPWLAAPDGSPQLVASVAIKAKGRSEA